MTDVWTILWILWGVMFAVVEGVAIYFDAKDNGTRTLSDHIRNWISVDTKLGRTAWLVISGVFFSWFVVHIAAGTVIGMIIA